MRLSEWICQIKKINAVPYKSPRVSTNLLQQQQRSLFPFSKFFTKSWSVPDGNKIRKLGLKTSLFMKITIKGLLSDSCPARSGLGLKALVGRGLHCSLQPGHAPVLRVEQRLHITPVQPRAGGHVPSAAGCTAHPALGKRSPSIS